MNILNNALNKYLTPSDIIKITFTYYLPPSKTYASLNEKERLSIENTYNYPANVYKCKTPESNYLYFPCEKLITEFDTDKKPCMSEIYYHDFNIVCHRYIAMSKDDEFILVVITRLGERMHKKQEICDRLLSIYIANCIDDIYLYILPTLSCDGFNCIDDNYGFERADNYGFNCIDSNDYGFRYIDCLDVLSINDNSNSDNSNSCSSKDKIGEVKIYDENKAFIKLTLDRIYNTRNYIKINRCYGYCFLGEDWVYGLGCIFRTSNGAWLICYYYRNVLSTKMYSSLYALFVDLGVHTFNDFAAFQFEIIMTGKFRLKDI